MQILLKGVIREEALSNLYGQPTAEETKKHLRYSHWASPKLFGPLPTSFIQYLLPNSNAQARYLLYSEPKKVSYGSTTGYHSASKSNKRPSLSNWTSSAPKKGRISDPPKTQIVAPAEALKLSGSQRARNFRKAGKQKGSRGFWKNKNRGRR